ncbi:STY4851/ECs_5259 family protein [Vibrio fluvialis]|uniref:STY4851/ECs_5259 family protein n=1 Tax=Vibrio fluvialis TaxID=676 RepID=UPI00215BD6F1|nr:STY4851/ECs_5259 family protein [Vibrio fluvialis]MCR9300774.1 STY4851/ECs_5259 family protein [Vibrio fluvialis]
MDFNIPPVEGHINTTSNSISPVTIEDWLTRLLHRNELSLPNGQPLYQYHVTESEFIELRNILIRIGKVQSSKNWCAAFSIFCSEWYRRFYMGDWTWFGIWESLGYELDANIRQNVVERGLNAYWGRPISQYQDERNSYLGSLFKEGGLPYGLLASEGSRFQAIFKRILKSYEDAKDFGYSPVELVTECMDSLPEAFKQETTVNLITRMTELLLRLTEDYNLDEQNNPAAYLDDNAGGWRELFPIPLDGNAGNEFLSGLLSSASHQHRNKKQADKRITCQQWLANTSECQFVTQIKLAKIVDMPFRREDTVTSRVELFIYEGSTPIAEIGVGHIHSDTGKCSVVLRCTSCRFNRVDPKQTLYLIVFQAGKLLHREEISNSEIMIGEVPVVLRCIDEKMMFVGTGSISTRAESLTVLCPPNTVVDESEAKDANIKTDYGYTVGTFSGTLKVSVNNGLEIDRYLIKTSANNTQYDDVRIDGKILPFSTEKGQPVYLGLPKITTQDICSQVLVAGEPVGRGHKASIFGLQSIKVKSNKGHTLFQKRLAILPKSFDIRLISSENADRGNIELHCMNRFTVKVLNAGVDVVARSTEYGKCLEIISALGMPPRELLLEITTNLMAAPVVVSVPFPSTGVLAYDKDSNKLPQLLTVADLLGSRLILFPRLGKQCSYKIELSSPNSSRQAYYLWEYKVQDQPLEISLYEFRHNVRELLATNGNLDDLVRLEISGACKTVQFQIGRYSSMTQFENSCIKFEGAIKDFGKIKPVLIDLTNPAVYPKPLTQRESQGVATGIFELSSSPENPSLIVPSPDSEVAFRARFVPGSKNTENRNDVRSLQKAATVCHVNPSAIDEVLGQMVMDFDHSGWTFLTDLETRFGYLPLATFEIWKSVVKRQDVLAALAFRFDNPIPLMSRLQSEFNVMWELIPIGAWKRVSQNFIQGIRDDGYPERIVTKLINQKLDDISQICPVFESDCRHLVLDKAIIPQENLRGVLQYFSAHSVSEVRSLHTSDRRWPTMFSNDIEEWCRDHYQDLVTFSIPDGKGFQKAVLYFPLYASALVLQKTTLSEIGISDEPANEFFLRQLIEFDRQWFVPMYKLLLCIMAGERK